VPSTRTKPADERRADLLDAGQEVLIERGIEATRIDDVTARAGVAKGTFYLYFGSKADLVAALRERFIDDLIARQAAATARFAAEDWPGRLDAWMEDAIRAYLEHAELHDVLFAHDSSDAAVATGITPENRHVDALRNLLAQRPDAPPGAPEPAIAAVLLYSAVHGCVHYLLHQHDAARADEMIAAARELAHRYLLID
jgi:AcrR family transcriptional regulator